MKYRIIISLIAVLILVGVYVLFQDQTPQSTPVQTDNNGGLVIH